MLLEDSVRFQGTGKLGLREIDREHGEMAWVEPAQLEYGYPALHELVVNIHALAFELNLKDPRLRLSHPFRGEDAYDNRHSPVYIGSRTLVVLDVDGWKYNIGLT